MEPTHVGPKQLGDFEILRQIGRGGMGIVYEARQRSLNRRVALKVLSSGLGLTTKAVQRFRREAEAAAKLHHTNIVPIYATGEEHDIHFYAMELIDGPSLDQVIRHMRDEGGESPAGQLPDSTVDSPSPAVLPDWVSDTMAYKPPSVGAGAAPVTKASDSTGSGISSGAKYFDQVARMMADVADALQHAHDEGVIHRDIKPSNLLLSSDGRLSLNDFGLARVLEQPGMTMSGEFVGSPLYMSPEQITAGRAPLDHRTDIYSLGATLYELLTLEPPFPGQQRDQIIGQILHKDPVPPHRKNRRVPLDLETICLKAMDKDPDRRYQTAGQLAKDLRNFVDRHAISARRIGWIGRAIKFTKRNPVVSAAIGVVLLMAVLSILQWRAHQEQQRLTKLESIKEDLYNDFFRGETQRAEALIDQARDLDAPDEWLEFLLGLKELMRQDYEDAKTHFQNTLRGDPDHVPAKALLAISCLSAGDEYEYLRRMAEIPEPTSGRFEDYLFLGYSHTWGNPELAYRLLDEADRIEHNLQFVRLSRGTAARYQGTLTEHELPKARELIDQAYRDIGEAAAMMTESPLVLREQTQVNLDRARVYDGLAEQDPEYASQFKKTAEESRAVARSKLTRLMAFQSNADAQYVIVLTLSELGLHEELRTLANRWLFEKLEVNVYPTQRLSIEFLTMRDYGNARTWIAKATGPSAQSAQFFETFIKLVDPDRRETFVDLHAEAERQLDRKRVSGDTQYLLFDIMLLCLLGDDEKLKYCHEDKAVQLVMNGAVYTPIHDYFGGTSGLRMSANELLAKCAVTPQPNASLMGATYCLGIESLANGQFPQAADYFRKCVEGRQYLFYHYWLSKAMLAHQDDWPKWHEERMKAVPEIMQRRKQ